MADITVMGAGVLGLSAAWAMARRGARVRVLDRTAPGAGASGGIVGALAPHVPETWNTKKAFQLDSLLMADSFWAEVVQAGGLDAGYARTGRVQPLADEAAIALAHERAVNAQRLWRGQATWQVVDNAMGWPIASPTGLFVQDTLSARLSPGRACAALVAALRATGNTVAQGTDPGPGPVLWATGAPGLQALSDALGQPIGNGVKGQAALFKADWRTAPQLFIEALHIVPHADGTVAVGSTSENRFDDPQTTDAQLDALIDRARALCPALRDAPVSQRWAGVRPRARSRAPLLDHWPDRPGHFVLNGGFKIGFGMAPKLAHLAADLVLTGHADIPADFALSASLRGK